MACRLRWAVIFMAQLVCSPLGAMEPPKVAIGKMYSLIRVQLLKEGNKPVDWRRNPDRSCVGAETECGMYPEMSFCAVDQDRPCRFEWVTADGAKFYVMTTGENPHDLVVKGLGY